MIWWRNRTSRRLQEKRHMVNTSFRVNNYAIEVNANLRSRVSQMLNLLSQLGDVPHQVSLALTIFIRGSQLQGASSNMLAVKKYRSYNLKHKVKYLPLSPFVLDGSRQTPATHPSSSLPHQERCHLWEGLTTLESGSDGRS